MIAPRALSAFLLLLPIACTTTAVDQHGYLPPPTNGGSTGHMPNGTLAVTITAPANPTTVGVRTDVVVTANAAVQGGSDYIDTSSVAVTVTAPTGSVVLANGVLVSTGGEAYSGKLSLGDLPAGMYTLTVSARSSSGTQGSDQIMLTVDGGPVITVVSPIADHGYNGSVAVDLTVDPGAFPLASGPTATIAGKPIPLTPPTPPRPAIARRWSSDRRRTRPGAVLLPDVAGKQLFQVQATNSIGVTDQVRVVFVIDKSGPTITATTPVTGDVVGGIINITATVTDDSGVLDSSVVAVISNEETPLFELPLAAQGSGIYGVLFDTSNLTRCPEPPSSDLCVVFPNISFRAVDLVGNQSVLSYGFSIDNIAPVADLDPPLMRQLTLSATGYQCSFAFDPLSVNQEIGDMPNDGCMVPQVFDLRARIEDDGNRASELKVTPISLVDPANTNVFIMPASLNQPLVVDSDGDGRCDQVNPLLTPLSPTAPPTAGSGVLQVRLAGVPPAGKADFEPDPTLPASSRCAKGTATARRSGSATRSSSRRLPSGTRTANRPSGRSSPSTRRFTVSEISSTRSRTRFRRAGPASPCRPATRPVTRASRCRCGSTSSTTRPVASARRRRPARARRRPARGPTILSRSAPRLAPAARARFPKQLEYYCLPGDC